MRRFIRRVFPSTARRDDLPSIAPSRDNSDIDITSARPLSPRTQPQYIDNISARPLPHRPQQPEEEVYEDMHNILGHALPLLLAEGDEENPTQLLQQSDRVTVPARPLSPRTQPQPEGDYEDPDQLLQQSGRVTEDDAHIYGNPDELLPPLISANGNLGYIRVRSPAAPNEYELSRRNQPTFVQEGGVDDVFELLNTTISSAHYDDANIGRTISTSTSAPLSVVANMPSSASERLLSANVESAHSSALFGRSTEGVATRIGARNSSRRFYI